MVIDHGIVAIGADNMAVEVLPNPDKTVPMPVPQPFTLTPAPPCRAATAIAAFDTSCDTDLPAPQHPEPHVVSSRRTATIELSAAPRLPLPAAVSTHRIVWPYAITVGVYHALALLALLPWFFSVTGVVVAVWGVYVFGSLGINLCYHRMLTHRGLVCPKWLEYSFAVLGVCCMQDTPAHWAAVHRRHHEHSDRPEDPHSPLAGFFWGHVGWMLVENRDFGRRGVYDRYAKDILRDPFYRRLECTMLYPMIVLGSWAVFFLAGVIAGFATGGDATAAVRFGASLLVWGVFVRIVLVWHITWSVNSLAHLWGYQNYPTAEYSRNNWLVAILSNGEGWHNNHHADPRSARHGHRWWEVDPIFGFVRILEAAGLARDVRRPAPGAAPPPG